ncbi:uncharacterized protein LACBIDRAFT_312463 [Laccaria bicolor S238N-H82]|uniref:Predicted protein n=1 Tax=Laccaria bicolor (strain S238N-H82 / ATCC MYA-4686) TaxID=486041 RepID=B0DN95_LACBS|nr:uncharacterized protein LACBIDRAFT_306538 [Laccaria bicolor S238N-H82]XP_001888183.1 uncharacterized protein LACBIDRAFT_312463 [Laccaria bicolor S238N-H82]EDR01141.1 predicted protein [Laccaria bicolor S238N-H82]EDR03898.1 predicted protein [Laccaria bicolor S238N-H82]|eukprot:XP_001885466.1 predicted protein [Laccaria bicolor S238N-H82]
MGQGWHVSFDHYYDNLSAKQCHGKPLPCNVTAMSQCVSKELANTIPLRKAGILSASYAALRYGAWVLELKGHLQAKVNGSSQMKYVHNVCFASKLACVVLYVNMGWAQR